MTMKASSWLMMEASSCVEDFSHIDYSVGDDACLVVENICPFDDVVGNVVESVVYSVSDIEVGFVFHDQTEDTSDQDVVSEDIHLSFDGDASLEVVSEMVD